MEFKLELCNIITRTDVGGIILLTIPNIILRSDLSLLPKENLYTICTDLGLLTEGGGNDLANRIWEKIKDDKELQNIALERDKSKLLVGKTSVTWYRLGAGATLQSSKESIIKEAGYNPFEQRIVPPSIGVTTTPSIIGAAQGENNDEYYLRFIYKDGVNTKYYGQETIVTPVIKVATVYMNINTVA